MKGIYIAILVATSLFSEESLHHKNIPYLVLGNYALGMPESEVKELEKMLFREKIREYLPKVGVSYFGFKNKNDNQLDSGYDEYRITFQQLLYDGGDTDRQKEILLLGARLEGEDRKQKIQKLLLDSYKLYFRCSTNLFKLNLSYKNKEKAQKAHKAISKEVLLGLKRNVDLLEFGIKLTEADFQLNRSKLATSECTSELARMIGWEKNRVQFSENILSDFLLFSPEASLRLEKELDSPEIKKARLILEKSKVELEGSENHWKPKLYAGGYYGKNSLDAFRSRHPSYGMDFSLVLPLGSSSLQSNGRVGIQEDGNGIQRIPGFGPQYVGTGENSYNSTGVQLFDNLSHSRKILEGEIKTRDAKRNLQEIMNKQESEKNKSTTRILTYYDTYKSIYLKLLLKIELLRQAGISFRLGTISQSELYSIDQEVYKLLIEYAEVMAEYMISVYEYLGITNMEETDEYFKYSRGSANLELKNYLEDLKK